MDLVGRCVRLMLEAGDYDAIIGFFTTVAGSKAVSGRMREIFEAGIAGYEDRLIALPGVESVTSTLLLPLANRSWERRVFPEGEAITPDNGDSVLYGVVSEGYFETMGVPIVAGRTFNDSDRHPGELVTVIGSISSSPADTAAGSLVDTLTGRADVSVCSPWPA